MERVKLTMKEAEDLEEALEHWEYRKDLLTAYHRNKYVTGNTWKEYTSLNGIDPERLESALYEGYDIEGEHKHFYSLESLQNAYNEAKEDYVPTKEEIEADIDYHLGALSLALEKEDNTEIDYCKEMLELLTGKLEELK